MRFKIDENLPSDLADDLQALGHDAHTVYDESLVGVGDPQLVEVARSESRILLTLDKGIANISAYPRESHAGIVLFRPGAAGRSAVLDFIRSRLPQVLARDLAGRVTVVTNDRIRSR